jgi:hypothetical protein
MKWPRYTIILVVGVIAFGVAMNVLSSDRIPEAWHFRNWPGWAHTTFGIGFICFITYALWTDIRDLRDAWRAAKNSNQKDKT